MTTRLPATLSAVVLIVAMVQLAPLIAALNPAALQTLYGVSPADDTTILLLRHRAVLLGLVGALLIAGWYWPHLLHAAILVALTSKLSYLLLYLATPEPTAAAARVAQVDVVTAALLTGTALLLLRSRGQ